MGSFKVAICDLEAFSRSDLSEKAPCIFCILLFLPNLFPSYHQLDVPKWNIKFTKRFKMPPAGCPHSNSPTIGIFYPT